MADGPKDLDFGEFLSRQAISNAKQRKFSYYEQEQAIDFILEVYLDALRHQAKALHVFSEGGDAVRFEIECPGNTTVSTQKNLSFSFEHLSRAVNERLSSWAQLGDSLCETASYGTPRLKFFPMSQYHFQANVVMRQSGVKLCDAISFNEISFENRSDTLEVLGLDAAPREFIKAGISEQSGLVLANRSSNMREVDGIAIVLAMRPDALFVREDDARGSLDELVAISRDHLVVVGSSQIDPIEMTLRTIGFAEGKMSLASAILHALRFVVVHRRLRRNCSACNKAAEVTTKIREYYPPEVRSMLKDSYSYGSRCPHCSFSGFRGSVGASSVLLVDERVKKLLREKSSGEVIAQHVYTLGTRPLLLDGLNKVFAGQTVFSDLHEAAPKLSPYFLSAVRISPELALNSGVPVQEVSEKRKDESTLAKPSPGVRKEEIAQKKRILIIEDDPAQRDILQLALVGQGYLVSAVEVAEDAFAILAQNHVDLVVSDYMLPGMNGAQFVEKLKADPRYKSIPVIILTVMGDEQTEFKILSGLADEFCSKDVSRRVLIKRIERLLPPSVDRDAEVKKNTAPNPLKHLLNE